MDDMAEYRRRHREAYLKRVGLDSQQSSDKSTSSKHNINNPGNNINNGDAENNNKFLSNNINDQKYMDELDTNDLFRDDLDRVSGLDEVDGIMGKRERDAELMDDEASLELAKKLQREFDSMEEVRKPDDSYKECLLSGPSDPINVIDENADMDLQRAIAKSLIDM